MIPKRRLKIEENWAEYTEKETKKKEFIEKKRASL